MILIIESYSGKKHEKKETLPCQWKIVPWPNWAFWLFFSWEEVSLSNAAIVLCAYPQCFFRYWCLSSCLAVKKARSQTTHENSSSSSSSSKWKKNIDPFFLIGFWSTFCVTQTMRGKVAINLIGIRVYHRHEVACNADK